MVLWVDVVCDYCVVGCFVDFEFVVLVGVVLCDCDEVDWVG